MGSCALHQLFLISILASFYSTAPRSGDNANGNGSDKIRAAQNFQKMGVKELREQAILRGISTTVSKTKLLKRLCNDAENKASNLNYDENNLQEEDESKKEKLIAATKRGIPVLDHWIPDDIKATYHVLQNPFRDMIEGMRIDLKKSRYKSFDELYLYCYSVVGTVGLMSVLVIGITLESKATTESVYNAALALGDANQLKNILRDVGKEL